MSYEAKPKDKKHACPECSSLFVWRKGKTPSRKGQRNRYVCVDCGKTFYGEKAVKPPGTA